MAVIESGLANEPKIWTPQQKRSTIPRRGAVGSIPPVIELAPNLVPKGSRRQNPGLMSRQTLARCSRASCHAAQAASDRLRMRRDVFKDEDTPNTLHIA
jgi:hypothetical protein